MDQHVLDAAMKLGITECGPTDTMLSKHQSAVVAKTIALHCKAGGIALYCWVALHCLLYCITLLDGTTQAAQNVMLVTVGCTALLAALQSWRLYCLALLTGTTQAALAALCCWLHCTDGCMALY